MADTYRAACARASACVTAGRERSLARWSADGRQLRHRTHVGAGRRVDIDCSCTAVALSIPPSYVIGPSCRDANDRLARDVCTPIRWRVAYRLVRALECHAMRRSPLAPANGDRSATWLQRGATVTRTTHKSTLGHPLLVSRAERWPAGESRAGERLGDGTTLEDFPGYPVRRGDATAGATRITRVERETTDDA